MKIEYCYGRTIVNLWIFNNGYYKLRAIRVRQEEHSKGFKMIPMSNLGYE